MNSTNDTEFHTAFEKAAKTGKSVVFVDAAKYQHMLDESGLDEAQKEEVLQALWSIIVAFVDLGFGVAPLSQSCGQAHEGLDPDAQMDSGKPINLSNDFKIPTRE